MHAWNVTLFMCFMVESFIKWFILIINDSNDNSMAVEGPSFKISFLKMKIEWGVIGRIEEDRIV